MINPQLVPLFEQPIICPLSGSVSMPSVWLYTDPPVIEMLDGAADHVGGLSGMVIWIVEPTEIVGVPLSVVTILKLQVWGAPAAKLTLQLAGKPEPATVGVNEAQLVPPEEHVKVCPVSRSVAAPFIWL